MSNCLTKLVSKWLQRWAQQFKIAWAHQNFVCRGNIAIVAERNVVHGRNQLAANSDRSNSAPTGDRKHAYILGVTPGVRILTTHPAPALFKDSLIRIHRFVTSGSRIKVVHLGFWCPNGVEIVGFEFQTEINIGI